MKNEISLDYGEVTHIEDHLENIKTALRKKGQVEAEASSPARKLERTLRYIQALRSDDIMPLHLQSQMVLSQQDIYSRNSCSKVLGTHQRIPLKFNDDD